MSKMIKKILLSTISILTTSFTIAQSNDEAVRNYIAQYKETAIQEQLRSGVPASITLAQGIYETGAGTSELCTNAQNHFGIKCKNSWTGLTYTYTDDAKDECFRSYTNALASYKDHSDFLSQNKRYASLFYIPVEDYSEWAKGLKRCGYATNPQYATKLIDMIERYDLAQYTHVATAMHRSEFGNEQALASTDPDMKVAMYEPELSTQASLETLDKTLESFESTNSSNEKPADIEYYKVTKLNGLKGFYAKKGDLLLEYAIKNKVRYSKLLEINDLYDEPLKTDLFIYLEKKHRYGSQETYTVSEGETLSMIAQAEGMQLNSLRSINKIEPGEEPMPGSVLYLQGNAPSKPNIHTGDVLSNNTNSKVAPEKSNDEYINTKKNTEEQATEDLSKFDDRKRHEEATEANASNQKVNITDETTVDEDKSSKRHRKNHNEQSTSNQEVAPAKTYDELDLLKQRFDKSVYTKDASTTTATTKENTQNTNTANTQSGETRPARKSYEDEQINAKGNPSAALQQHMNNVKQEERDYQPKSNKDQLIKAKNAPAAQQKNTESNKPATKPTTKQHVKPSAKQNNKPAAKGKPNTKPQAKPGAKPATKPAAKLQAKPTSKSNVKPAAKPATKKPTAKPAAKPAQKKKK